jgi:hypothetical protein
MNDDFVAFFIPGIMTQLLHKKGIYNVIGLYIEVCKTLTHEFLEIIFKDALEQGLAGKRCYIRGKMA